MNSCQSARVVPYPRRQKPATFAFVEVQIFSSETPAPDPMIGRTIGNLYDFFINAAPYSITRRMHQKGDYVVKCGNYVLLRDCVS